MMAANRIKGITIELNGDATPLQNALKSVDKSLRSTQDNLKDIGKLLKLDPGNVELLTQKQKNLESAISGTKDRLEQLKAAQSGVEQGTDEWDALQREIVATEQDLKKLEDEYRAFGSVGAQQVAVVGEKMKDLGGSLENAGRAFSPISKAAAGALTGLGALTLKVVESGDELNTLAKQTGLTTEQIQMMQYASDLVDVSLEDITGALGKMKKNMTGHADAWAQIGVSVTNADGSMRDATDVFYDALTGLSQISNETERDQLAMELFGKSADQLAGIIDDGGASLKAYGQEAKNLGLILDQDTVNALNDTQDAIDRAKAQIKGSLAQVGATLAQTFAPALKDVTGWISKAAAALKKLTPQQAKTIVKITAVVAAIAPLLTVGGKLIKGIGSMLTLAPKIVSGVKLIAGVISPTTLVIAGIAAVALVVYKNWDKIVAFFKDKVVPIFKKAGEDLRADWDRVKQTAEAIKTGVVNAWNALKTGVVNAATAVRDGAVNAWNSLKISVVAVATSIKDGVVNAWNALKTGVVNAATAVKDGAVNAWNSLKSSVVAVATSVKDGVVNAWNALKSSVVAVATSIKDGVVNAWNALKSAVVAAATSVKDGVVNAWNALKSSVVSVATSIKDGVVNAWNALKSTVVAVATSVKDGVSNAWISLKGETSTAWENIKSSVVQKATALKDGAVNAWNGLKSAASNIVTQVKSAFNFNLSMPSLKLPTWGEISGKISSLVSNLKNAFKFDWSLPHIKLPHFSVQGGKWPYGLGGMGYLPSISVSWYKKAYENAVMFKNPTVLSTPYGYKGFGDGTGAEIVLGLNKLRELVGTSQSVVINVYGAQGQSVDALADAVQQRLIAIQKQREAAYA